MALKTFNVQGGLSIGSKGDIFDANANLNLSNSIGNVTLGNVSNLHISGGNANGAILGSVTLNGDGNVTAIAISSRGDGYTIAPIITISGANSSAANATVSLFANGALNTITINDAGTGYNSGTVTASVAGPSSRYLRTDGVGNLSWFEVVSTGGSGGGGTPGGSNTFIQFNDNGAFNGTDGFTFNKVSNAITAGGTITAANFVGADLTNGNSSVAITSNGNITLTATSNATIVVSDTGANIAGTANITGDILAGANVNVSANINGGTFQNGNSNIKIGANANITISSNGQSNILSITSNSTHAQSTFQNDLTVTGNLTVSGNAIYANTEVLTIEDPIIELGTGANGSILTSNDGKDRGVELHSYGNGATYTTSGSTPSGNTTIVLASTSGIVSGQLVTIASNPNAIPVGTTVSTVNAGNIVISTPTTATIAGASTLQIGNDILRFMGWSNANAAFQFYSVATVTNEVVTGTLGNVVASNFVGILANGNSNVSIPAANGNVNISAVGNANVVVITGTGANITGTLNASGNANVGNLGTTTAIITTGNITTINSGLLQNGNSNITITSNANVTITAKSNATMVISDTGANIAGTGNFSGNLSAANLTAKAAGSLIFTTGNSQVGAATLTTSTATANQSLAVIPAVDGRAVEFIVKGIDSTGAKYSAATILASIGNAANGDCDFTTYAQLNTGLTTGDVTVALTDSNANITLQVTPASTNSTVWTTQYRVI